MNPKTYLPLSLFVAGIALSSLADGAPGKKKAGGKDAPGVPAYLPDPSTPPFDPSRAKPDHLDPSLFTVAGELEITVWATSPQLYNPTNIDTDAAGRIWVAEGINYRQHAGRNREGDAIRVLQDTNGDGKCDSSHVFVREKEMEVPLGVAVFDNVIFVSQGTSIIKYTDVNRNQKFEAGTDKREVFLTGFEKPQHDHGLHSVSGGPDGRLMFSNGNFGAVFTDKSGKIFRIAGIGQPGEKSDDGKVYVGGFTVSVGFDGDNAKIVGFNYRNSYEGSRNSFGDMFVNDNDDPPACRTSHLIEGGNFGFFSPDGLRSWKADKRPGQSVAVAEWRQDDPGVIPAGDVYGNGAPTGMCFVENSALGPKWRGLLLSGESVRNSVLGYFPERTGAGFKLERSDFLTSRAANDDPSRKDNRSRDRRTQFRPSDICVGADGALYLSDWFDPRSGGHEDYDKSCSGTIYRIAPKGFKPVVPAIDFGTPEGLVTALRSPANNVRFAGFRGLVSEGGKALPLLKDLLRDEDPYIAARAIWVLPKLGPDGVKATLAELDSKDELRRLTALRALRAAEVDLSPYLDALVLDQSAMVLAELAIALREVPNEIAVPVLSKLVVRLDPQDRSALESWGLGCRGREAEVWDRLGGKAGEAVTWTDGFARVVWRLHPPGAVTEIKKRAMSPTLTAGQRQLAIETLAFTQAEAAADAMIDLAAGAEQAVKNEALYWLEKLGKHEWSDFNVAAKMKARSIVGESSAPLVSVLSPEPTENLIPLKDVLALKGDAKRGATIAGRCVMCHQVDGQGVEFGPGLDGWGRGQTAEVIATAILDPSHDIAHGYEGTEIITKSGLEIHGIIIDDGAIVMMRSIGGLNQKIPLDEIRSRKPLERSLMMSASQLGMTATDVADLIAFLRK